ncbi:MAG TPA: hypothetical protein VL860_00820 [Planctomycetota bacterium]|nr:hypothetical protein [Planctomycetota bacterium]
MKTIKHSFWILAAALLVLPLAGLHADENAPAEGQGGPKGKGRAAVLAHLGKRGACIQKHIEKLTAAIAKHPNAPANIKADAQQVLTDLAAKQATVAKLIGDVQAHNKDAAKTDRAELKAECATTKTDRATLKADREAFRAAHKGGKGHKNDAQ